jgi:hypothetical protein
MNKQSIALIVLSLVVIILPATVIALILGGFFGHFWSWFGLSCAILFVIGQLSNSFFSKKMNIDIIRLQTRLEEIANQQNVEVSCAYCRTRNITPVYLNQRNTFTCSKCKQVNLIIFQFAAAQVTVPLESPQLGATTPNVSPQQ